MEGIKSYLSLIDPRLFQYLNGKSAEFIKVLQEGKFLNEEAFIQHICGEKYDEGYYRLLKFRTREALQILLMVHPEKGASSLKKKFEKCQKKFFVGQKLLSLENRNEGMRLIEQAYKIAVKYEFLYLACELSGILHQNHIYYNRSSKKVDFYSKQIDHYLQAYVAEKKTEKIFLSIIHRKSSSLDIGRIQRAIQQINQLNGSGVKYKSYQFTLQVLLFFCKGEYKQVIECCNFMLTYLKDKPGAYRSHFHFFFLNKGIAGIATAQYEMAKKSFTMGLVYVKSRPFNRYLLHLYLAINALHAGQYTDAHQLVQQNRRCRFEPIKEQFTIVEAYLCFLSHMGCLQVSKPFRLGKFLNETLTAQTDKQGDQINILIAELLIHLVRDRGRFIDRVESARTYSYRHLKGQQYVRAKWFIKILCTLPRANFHPTALRRLAKYPIEKLESHPIHMGEHFAIEIVPFSTLLELLFQHIQQRVA